MTLDCLCKFPYKRNNYFSVDGLVYLCVNLLFGEVEIKKSVDWIVINNYYSAWVIHRWALFLSITSSFYYYFKANPNAVSSPFPVLLCFGEFYRTLLSVAHAILPYQGTSLKIKYVSHCILFGGRCLGLVGGWLICFLVAEEMEPMLIRAKWSVIQF